MRKIAIVTITYNLNYGNVLQNIAMQKIINKLGFKAETIINCRDSSMFGKKKLINKMKILLNYKDARVDEKRRLRFLECCKNNLSYSNSIYNGIKFSGSIDQYEFFVVGSDQVWNPFFSFATNFEFLMFAPREKKISYAASFGVNDFEGLDEAKLSIIDKGICDFQAISVREEAGRNIVRSYTKKDCFVHIDPTMLLDRSEWDVLAYKPNINIPDKYLLVYMLGDITDQYRKIIYDFANNASAVVINILDKKYKCLDPLEFVWMISRAYLICTDSFHASVFSILFHKDFYIFNREDSYKNQNSRFLTLFEKCSINGNFIDRESNFLPELDVDWEIVEFNLLNERKASIQYLKNQFLIDF